MNFAKDHWAFVAVAAYLLLFMGGVVGIQIWKIRRRRERPPVAFKLLRGPGETLRRRVTKSEEDFVFRIFGAALVPVFAALAVLGALIVIRPSTPLSIGLGLTALVFLATLVPAGRWALRDLIRFRDDRLGYLGEREVAEHLQPLFADGYRVFHDVPAEGAKKAFNLDHVTVGPTGVALIETKTRRKGRARPGFKDHVVVFDGQRLIWPWGEDTHGLDQAKAEADWLGKWINQRTGIDMPVKPILALPGWWVEAKARDTVTVVNSKSVASAVEGNSPRTLTDQQIDLIARQLDALCRDVVD